MINKANSLIFDINRAYLTDFFELEYSINEKSYKRYYYDWCNTKNTKFQNDILRYLKEKFMLIKDFEHCTLTNILYVYTYKNKIVYIGKSSDYSLRIRYGYHKQLFGEFREKCNCNSKNKDWNFYVYKIKKKQDIDQLESYLINWFALNEYPTLNVKCENIQEFFKMFDKGKLL